MQRHCAQPDLLWALGSLCQLHRQPFDGALVAQQFPALCDLSALQLAAKALGLKCSIRKASAQDLRKFSLPFVALLKVANPTDAEPETDSEPIPLQGADSGEDASIGNS